MDRANISFITQRIKKKQNISEILYQILERIEIVLETTGSVIVMHGLDSASESSILIYPQTGPEANINQTKLKDLGRGCGEIHNRLVLSAPSLNALGLTFPQIKDELFAVAEPIIINNTVEGVILAIRENSRKFSSAEYEILQLFASQASMAIENSALISTVQERAVRVLQMNHLTNAALRAGDLQSLLRVVSEGMADLIHADGCLIVLWDEDRGEPVPMSAFGPERDIFPQTKLSIHDHEMIRNVLSASRPYLFEDFSRGSFNYKKSMLFQSAQAGMALPLITGKRWLGVIFLTYMNNHAFQEEEIQLCEQAAAQAVLALAKTQAFEAEQQRNVELEALRLANLSITSSLDIRLVLETILEQTLQMVDGEDAHVFLYEGDRLMFGAARWTGEYQREPYKEPRKDGLTYSVARSGRRIVVEDVSEHPLFKTWNWGGAIIGLPIRVGNHVLGVMNVAYDKPHKFSQAEIRVLELMADQASIALENARLFDRMDAERRRVSFLYDVAREVGSSLSLKKTLKQATERIRQNLDGYLGSAFIYYPEVEQIEMVCSYSRDETDAESWNVLKRMSTGDGIEGWVVKNRECAVLDDFRSDPRWKNYGIVIPDEVVAMVAMPLLSGEDLYGVISILAETPFDQAQVDMVQAVSHQIGLALSNAASYQSLQRKLNERQLLQQIAQAVNRRYELEPLLKEVVDQIAALLDLELVEVFLRDGDVLRLRAANTELTEEKMDIPIQEGIVGRAAREEKPLLVEDVSKDPDFVGDINIIESEIAVPLKRADEVIGILNVEASRRRRLQLDDLRLLTLISDQIAVASERASLYGRLRNQTLQLEELVAERTAELESALEKAQQADKLKTQFVADVSHELRTPLTNIQLYLELLEMGSEDKSDEYMSTLHRETERLTTLIESLLAISRLDTDTVRMNIQELDLNALVERLVQDRRRLFTEKDVALTFEPEHQLSKVMGDEGSLSQVVANLLTNALQYTQRGGSVSLHIRTCQKDGQDGVCVDVQDTGLGISNEEQNQLFTRFFRGSASRRMKTSGTGLGLAICKEILNRHHGDITVRSQLNEGTIFTIWLPANSE
ncbi:MAG: GAF domain-containing protein [Anaerolineales bacterium]|nr:GAF domain-containing protein [Anaerolineales bacterium]